MHSPDTARRIANARRNHNQHPDDPRVDLRINTRDTPTPPSHHAHHTSHHTSGHHRRHSSEDFLRTTPAAHQQYPFHPSTPPERKRSPSGARSLRAPVRNAADIESFLQSLGPVDTNMSSNKESDPSSEHPSEPSPESARPPHRDSHDLSLSPRQFTRDSLVTNMLLGLDKLSLEQMGTSFGGSRNAFDDSNIYSYGADTGRTMSFNSRAGRGHAYTYSSDYEADDRSSRRRRSNSSSGYQSCLGRINSMRELGGTPRAIHSRSGKGSKGSSTNSIDPGYVQVLGSQRWARGFGRSSSFDYGDARPSTSQQAPWHIEFSKSLFDNGNDHDYDAAPTPHVPAGPRRLTTVPSLPVLAPIDTKTSSKLTPKAPSNDRPRSMRSSKSASTVRQSEVKYNAQRDVPSVPPVSIPPFDVDAAPAPHVGYEKTKDAVLDNPINAIQQAIQQPREKPGFFRRMFGSSKANSQSPPTFPYLSSVANDSSSNKMNSLKSPTIPPVREPPQTVTHTLQKKTSSFFKRRKQSITEMEPPPIPHMLNKSPARIPRPDTLTARPEPSPMGGSLRRAMDPFLMDSPTIQSSADAPLPSTEPSDLGPLNRSLEDSPEIRRNKDAYQRGFSPDYEPSPKAIIRAVDPNSSSDSVVKQPRIELPGRPALDRTMTSPPRSFLRDDSESEYSPEQNKRVSRTESRKVSLKPGKEQEKKRRSSSPTVSKSKSYPSLGKPKEDLKAPARQNSKVSSKATKKPSLPSLRIDGVEPISLSLGTGGLKTAESIHPAGKSELDEPEQFVVGDPTEDDQQKALKIYEGNEDFIPKEKAAAWMGEEGPVRQRTLRAYMENYDFENMSVCASLRQLCNRLLLRAETQQVDRILVAFSNRWCECNPNHGFKSMDIIHTICYSIMLLNTDLHMADIEHKMTKSQFIKNTMTTIRQALEDSVPEAFERPSILPGKASDIFQAASTADVWLWAPFDGPLKGWESQVEAVLKDIYSSIRDESLPLFGGAGNTASLSTTTQGSLSVMGVLKRSPSVLSKAPSEGMASTRGRIPEGAKANSSRWNSKSRSRPRGFGNGFNSSRTSFDDGNSLWSPTESSATWSKASLGRTHTTMSMDSFGSSFRGDYQQSIGFANALSQAIIREDNTLDLTMSKTEDFNTGELLEDESLELAGPPWVKEGMVTHKHHMETADKRSKERAWNEVFAVIQKGQLNLFSFSPNKSTSRKRGMRSNAQKAGGVVGGGNWQDNAVNMGTFSLRQTLATIMPPPGYSRARPHVWCLALPDGAVHLFHVGTAEIAREFMTTANYWSARLSTHPMIGGVSNIEYGWSDAVINTTRISGIQSNGDLNNLPAVGTTGRPASNSISSNHKGHSRPGSAANAASAMAAMGVGSTISGSRASLQSRRSVRSSSFDFGRPGSSASSGALGLTFSGPGSLPRPNHPSSSSKLPGDKIHIAEWTPPAQSLRPSTLSEREQFGHLITYVRSLDEDFQKHNALRSPMLLAFSPRSVNAVKAMTNWERKSQHLLNEIVKYNTYIECLREAEIRRSEIYRERENARRAARGEDVVDSDGEESEPLPGEMTMDGTSLEREVKV
ncbi:unnamed protein product [Sordaria macrospora k-hell]|uniref:WGS project CABT00000000 data, contig 2.9 n=1 Tax=Sordaria macrospora (strain ATCC MYA-333 / DSM 997 / K(L3346) / K-hell) TaxID=771870 RepID=F7VVG6_SORMK|nr:uncharacterized protein SMAC_03538 [Sordaria macrospora k-hell]CCC09507.1 unnamed protein product [Sordaria macrospora k-hell]